MNKTISNVLAALLIALTGAAQAAVVYNNGAPNQTNANRMTKWIQSEDFSFAASTTFTDVHFWTLEAAGAFSGEIDYFIYADAGGIPGAVLASGVGAGLTHVATGISAFGLSEFALGFNITPFLAAAGVTYHLGLHNGPLTNTADTVIAWEATDPNATARGLEFNLTTNGPWSNNEVEHAFNLTNDAAAVIPEPATLALLGIGLAGLGFGRRARLR